MKLQEYLLLRSFLFASVVEAGRHRARDHTKVFGDEAQLLRRLMRGYDSAVRPVANASHTIVVKVNFALTQILDMDEKNQVLTTNVWFSQEWKDAKLKWDPKEYNGLTKIRIPPKLIWRPDIVLYNGVDDYGAKVYSQCLAMVSYDGTVFWAPMANFRSTCKLDLTFFPFDDQVCRFKIGSWTYDGFQVDLTNKSSHMDMEQYTVNGGWDLIGTHTKRNVVYYPCCPEPFPDVTFTIYLHRRSLYYILNVVIPCMLLSGLSMLSFWLPVGTSEKVSLGLTVLLAFYVLGLSISERIPETSEYVPLIGVYLMNIMVLTSISVALCVFILHLHRLGNRGVRVPVWLHRFVTRHIAPLVRMKYILKYRSREHHQPDGCDVDELKTLHNDLDPMSAVHLGGNNITSRPRERINGELHLDDLSPKYKLIQVEGSGLYILAKDDKETNVANKQDHNDFHKVSFHGNSRGELRPMTAIMVPDSEEAAGPQDDSAGTEELMWHDIAEIIDRLFFYLFFLTKVISTLCILVVVPLFKEDVTQKVDVHKYTPRA